MSGTNQIEVRWLGKSDTVCFAAEELARYLGVMTATRIHATHAPVYDAAKGIVWVGEAPAFGGTIARRVRTRHSFDDRIFVQAVKGRVVVAGANPRSVLFSAYRYLEALGCQWFRPGPLGERVPRLARPLRVCVDLDERPSARHRVICIEGACSQEHVLSMIDYATKRGFNAYFLQFRNSFTFFERWYRQEAPARRRTFTPAEAQRICDRVKAEASRRGLILHTVGHGWTCEPFGIAGDEWAPTRQKIPAAAKPCFAEVKGKRELWGGIPLNTNLCYGQPAVRRRMAEAVADYAATHPGEAVVHVWLADGANNQCECPKCRPQRPSDWYVQVLNEIDRRLTARRLATKIVFLAYVDLLWGPRKQRLRNPDRFILMFAPITRSYSHAFLDGGTGATERVGPYDRNRLVFPSSPKANLRLLQGWKRMFRGDCVDFDYHLWGDWRNDPGQMQLARVLHRDVCHLRELGMQGFISCQNQRPLFPTGIWMEVMARGLWNAREPFELVIRRYFRGLFGRDAGKVQMYLSQISWLFDPAFLRGEKKGAAARRKELAQLARIPGAVTAFRPRIRAGCRSGDPVTREAWRLMGEHAGYVEALVRIRQAWLKGKAVSLTREVRALEKTMDRRLPRLNPVLDTWTVRQGLPRKPVDAQ